MSHSPLELAVIMVGTNDTKERFRLTPYNIAQGIARLSLKAKNTAAGLNGNPPKVLVVAPPCIGQEYVDTDVAMSMGTGCAEKSRDFPAYLREMLSGTGIDFLDASSLVQMNRIDYMHLDKEGHAQMAKLIAQKIREIF